MIVEESTINSFELTDKEADEIDTDVADYLSGKTKDTHLKK